MLLDAPSRRTYANFLVRLPDLLGQAFTQAKIAASWEQTGYAPFDQQRCVERCTTWPSMTSMEANAVLDAHEFLVERVREVGEVEDDFARVDGWVGGWVGG